MKEIIVAIDFSKGSINALKYAITIANKTDSDIMMVWVKKPSSNESLYSVDKTIMDEAKKRFESLVFDFKNKLKGKLNYKVLEGKVYKEIVNLAKYTDADLIISGTHGVSGFEKYWIGSNAYKIVSASECPVITVRNNYNVKTTIKRIVLPIDDSVETRHKVPFAAEIAKAFDAEVHILLLYHKEITDSILKVESYSKQVADLLKGKEIKYVLASIKGEKDPFQTIKYAEKVEADLIAIMTEQEESPLSFILGKFAQETVNYSPIPVLTVQPKEIFNTSSGIVL
jgi:nucleotide-binding universal stress UspA family protein